MEKAKNIIEMLADVLDVAPLTRGKYLDGMSLSDKNRQEIESLLTFENESDDFMSVSWGDISKDFFTDDEIAESHSAGQKVGIYEIEKELGLGGMGVVYLAHRRDGKFEQKVAVKVLKRELNVEKIRRNFEREREILARLEHPNIARLLDAGTTDEGVPFLVMEYIEGLPVDKFCAENSLDLNSRLKLFQKICGAVSFAHRNLIIHRDLKPSNIIVNEKGEPKLLDFGISKLLDAENAEERSVLTMLGAMTPEYASPEQIRGETVTTATDIYSLGVVLFKILTGSHPFALKGKTNGELLKVIAENEPTTPSAVQSSKYGNPKSKIQNPKFLKGDIDNIILKSLRKEPQRRYATVEQFSADIWRFIDGLPVLARPATVTYRASKFFQRNKIAVIAAVLIFLSLITGIIVAFRQTTIAVEARNVAQQETNNARTEQAKSEKISKFMATVISYANPAWFAEGSRFDGEAKVIDALLDLSGKIDTEFAGEPDVAAELHHKFSEVFLWVGKDEKNPENAEFKEKRKFHALRALELRRLFYGERHELVAKDMWYAAEYLSSSEREKAGICAQAIQMMRETNPNNLNLPYMLEGYSNRLMMPNTPQTHEVFLQAAIPQTDENKYQMGERLEREALPVFRLYYPEDTLVIVVHQCQLAYALAMQDKWAEFDGPYRTCKQGEARLRGTESGTGLGRIVEFVDRALANKKTDN